MTILHDDIELLDTISEEEKDKLIDELAEVVMNSDEIRGKEGFQSLIASNVTLSLFIKACFIGDSKHLFVLKGRICNTEWAVGELNSYGDMVDLKFSRWHKNEQKYYEGFEFFSYGQHVICSLESIVKVLLAELTFRFKAAEYYQWKKNEIESMDIDYSTKTFFL